MQLTVAGKSYDALHDSDPQQKLAKEWARRILQLSNDEKQARQAEKEDLNELKEMCEELLRDGKPTKKPV